MQAQKAKEREEDEHLVDKLDSDFASLAQTQALLSLTESTKVKANKSDSSAGLTGKEIFTKVVILCTIAWLKMFWQSGCTGGTVDRQDKWVRWLVCVISHFSSIDCLVMHVSSRCVCVTWVVLQDVLCSLGYSSLFTDSGCFHGQSAHFTLWSRYFLNLLYWNCVYFVILLHDRQSRTRMKKWWKKWWWINVLDHQTGLKPLRKLHKKRKNVLRSWRFAQ